MKYNFINKWEKLKKIKAQKIITIKYLQGILVYTISVQ